MTEDRRRFLLSGALALAGLAAQRTTGAAQVSGSGASASPDAAEATQPRPIDLEAAALPAADGTSGPARLSYGGLRPRVLRIQRGTPTPIRIGNHLDEPTSLDWHGMRLANGFDLAADIGPNPCAPGSLRDIVLTSPDSGTFWFHAGTVPGIADQTARGLAGVVIVEEPDPPEVDLDAAVLLTDNGSGAAGLSDRLLANGAAWPVEVMLTPGARLRLRLVNGSTREALAATVSGARPLVVAIDGQPSELFRPLGDTVPIGPGARFDLMIDLPRTAGAEVRLMLDSADAAAPKPDRPVFLARTAGDPRAVRPSIGALTPNPALPSYIPLEHSVRAEVAATSHPGAKPGDPEVWSINAAPGLALAKAPLFSAKRSSAVTLAFVNRSARLTGFRLHGHVMRLLHAKDDGWEPYWRDSVTVPPGATSHVAFLADNPGRWLIESPFFDQAAHGLRCWFEVR